MEGRRIRVTDRPRTLRVEDVARALAETSSRRVLASCVRSPTPVKEIAAATGIPLATVYRQVHRLMELGVLVVERSAMTADGKKYDMYRSRVKEAHLDLADAHEGVRWEPNDVIEQRLVGVWDAFRGEARGAPGDA